MIHIYNRYVYSEKLLALIENIEARIAEKKRESEEQGRSWEDRTVEIHSHTVASYNGRMALVKRGTDHRGLILVEFLSGSPTACPLTANVLPENLRRIPDGASQERKKTQEEMQVCLSVVHVLVVCKYDVT